MATAFACPCLNIRVLVDSPFPYSPSDENQVRPRPCCWVFWLLVLCIFFFLHASRCRRRVVVLSSGGIWGTVKLHALFAG